jgi:hypothetical protein
VYSNYQSTAETSGDKTPYASAIKLERREQVEDADTSSSIAGFDTR